MDRMEFEFSTSAFSKEDTTSSNENIVPMMNNNGTDIINILQEMIIKTIYSFARAMKNLLGELFSPFLNLLERSLNTLEELLSEIVRTVAPTFNQICNYVCHFLKQLLDYLESISNNSEPISSLIPLLPPPPSPSSSSSPPQLLLPQSSSPPKLLSLRSSSSPQPSLSLPNIYHD
ncbi:uncharacterized protein LOC122632944 isoform X2 [Vespula pensylvanica]|uniref:uncharacterized protein LOC122632944 isoform X2 n=1 Tax=Vespula pensylvanica TaxID=30213 RepID=UPI001CBA1E86|nr:uncharacterized protein LOC122632944 isoform X2 [Vespula pensylvanica]